MLREFLMCSCAVAFLAFAGLMGCARDEPVSSAVPTIDEDIASDTGQEKMVVTPSITILDAAWVGDIEAMRQHIAAGTDINTRGEDGGTALNAAAVRGNDEIAALLIDAGADVNAKKADGATPLHTAAFFCHEKIVRALLANGADKTMRTTVGATAYDSVAGPFEDVKPIYDVMVQMLGPLGLEVDYERIRAERPNIAETLSAQ